MTMENRIKNYNQMIINQKINNFRAGRQAMKRRYYMTRVFPLIILAVFIAIAIYTNPF
jgi:hypothetical protein